MPTQKITALTQLNPPGGGGGYTPPATTAANDFQVGDGSGNWIKNTLAQVITTLQTLLDSIYLKLTGGTLTGTLSVNPTYADSDTAKNSLSVAPIITALTSNISRVITGIYKNININSPGASSLSNTIVVGMNVKTALANNVPISQIVAQIFSASSHASAVQVLEGIDGNVYNYAGTATDIFGVNVRAYIDGGSATNVYGHRIRLIAQTAISGTSSITNAYGMYAHIGAQNIGGGTPSITNAYGIYLANFAPDSGYTNQLISNITQLFIERPTNGVSTNYSIVSNGINWFLSGAVTDVPVTIKGFAGQTAHLTEWQDSTGAVLAYIDATGNFSGATSSSGVTLRALTADLVVPDTGSMVVIDYFNVGSHALTLTGDACLQIL